MDENDSEQQDDPSRVEYHAGKHSGWQEIQEWFFRRKRSGKTRSS
jgi:hypothetical protein